MAKPTKNIRIMHKLPLFLTAILILSGIHPAQAGQYTTPPDTLTLKTTKHEGYGLFGGGYWSPYVEEIAPEDERRKIIPQGISELKVARQEVDIKVLQYHRLVESQHEYLPTFLEINYPGRIDTANLPSPAQNGVEAIIGQKDGKPIFIVDENGNRDYRDDPIRPLLEMSSAMKERPVQCHYAVYNGKEIIPDVGWVYFGLSSDEKVKVSVAQYLSADYSIGGQHYQLDAISWMPFTSFCFDSPKISITAQNGVAKDSLLFSEQYELGEYLELGGAYYQFASIANDGSTITLIREDDVSDKIGTQAGFIAPDFEAVSTSGHPLALNDYRGQYLLLTNITACWSKKMSYEYYRELWDDYHEKMAIVAIDESPLALQNNIEDLGLKGEFIIGKDNPSVKKTYREDYCSRVCFLIDPTGRIVDRFEISDWQESLAKHFK